MEKEIVIVEEKKYQEIKKIMNKESDYFNKQDFANFNAVFNATP